MNFDWFYLTDVRHQTCVPLKLEQDRGQFTYGYQTSPMRVSRADAPRLLSRCPRPWTANSETTNEIARSSSQNQTTCTRFLGLVVSVSSTCCDPLTSFFVACLLNCHASFIWTSKGLFSFTVETLEKIVPHQKND